MSSVVSCVCGGRGTCGFCIERVGAVSGKLPLYRCHKEVRALKIDRIIEQTAGAVIVPADTRYAHFTVNAEYVGKHQPKAGGYYVVYEDGYASYSPAKAFESGYTKIE